MATRSTTLTKAEITRTIRAAQDAGLTVFEVAATKQGVRIVTADGGAKGATVAENPWDKALSNGAA